MFLGEESKCVDTTGYCFRTGFWDSELVSTHRCTVSAPQADCVDTQTDCVGTTGYCFRTSFWDSELVSTHRWTGKVVSDVHARQSFPSLTSHDMAAASLLPLQSPPLQGLHGEAGTAGVGGLLRPTHCGLVRVSGRASAGGRSGRARPLHRETVPEETVAEGKRCFPQSLPRDPKTFLPTISPFQRFSRSNVSVDHVNPGRGGHTESTSHGDRKLCSTRLENSSPGRRNAYVSTIQNRHSETVDKTLVSQNFVPGSKFHRGANGYKTPIRNGHSETLVAPLLPHAIRCHFRVEKPSFCTPKLQFRPTISPFQMFSHSNVTVDHVNFGNVFVDHVNPGRGKHMESASHGDRKLCLTRRENSSPGGWARAADAIAYGHPFAQTGITFRSVIGIIYKTPIQNRHSETLVASLLPQAIRHHFGAEKP
ncbi:hypothetical protein Taro_044674 [Colocasia esculenta]|uniref:Uncharacterized protein n=1 Tax=Colocasia esculenta TaxID=4460 RepID=A0A843WMH7_COLES|nr:hypothetical protein [Colocasia esculenta]